MSTEQPPDKPDQQSEKKERSPFAVPQWINEQLAKFNKETEQLRNFGSFVKTWLWILAVLGGALYGVVVHLSGFLASVPAFLLFIVVMTQLGLLAYFAREGRKRNIEEWLSWLSLLGFAWGLALGISIHYLPSPLTLKSVVNVYMVAGGTLTVVSILSHHVITYLLEVRMRAMFAYHFARVDATTFDFVRALATNELNRLRREGQSESPHGLIISAVISESKRMADQTKDLIVKYNEMVWDHDNIK